MKQLIYSDDLIRQLPRPDYREKLISEKQTAKEIAQAIRVAERDSRGDAMKLRRFFLADKKIRSCHRVYWFLRNRLKYEAEPKEKQTVKTIRRYIVDGIGDCKHYSGFAVSVLNACGVYTHFRIVKQSRSAFDSPNHIYAVSYIAGRPIIIDPCVSVFAKECRYYEHWDVTPL